MLEYIYFVKCPNCEDEHFDFFDEAKEFALGCMSKKPIITQIEVDRNDFGECVDSCDLGTVWSWEDLENITDDEPTVSVFTRDDLEDLGEDDPEFAALDNSLDFEPDPAVESEPKQALAEPTALDAKPDNFRKPIPENAIHDGGFRTDGYRTALACYDSDDFDINVEFGLQNEEEYEVKDQLYLLRPGQTVADLVVYLSRRCGFTNVYVYGETSATRGEMKTATRFETEPGTHDYRHYGTIEDRLVEKCDQRTRKTIPEGMTIEQLVEEMEENEDTVECVCCQELYPKEECKRDEKHGWICPDCADEVVECTWCEELYDRSECRYEVDLGWLCDRCEDAIKSRGETLTFRENNYWDSLDEGVDNTCKEIPLDLTESITEDTVELEYEDITAEVPVGSFDSYFDGNTWLPGDNITDEVTTSFVFNADRTEVEEFIMDLIPEDYIEANFPGGVDAFYQADVKAQYALIKDDFDELFERYNKEILERFRKKAEEAFYDAWCRGEYDYSEPDYDPADY